jgi:hypothetical protein
MSSPDRSPEAAVRIAVVGAGGAIGRRVAAALVAGGAHVIAVARRPQGRAGPTAIADARDADVLAGVLAGARVVVNAAAPLRDTAAPVLSAALASGAHYVDVGGEQAALRALYERHESAVRRAGLIAVPGAGLDGLVGDLAAGWAAAHLAGDLDAADPDAPPVRAAPAARTAEGDPLDEVAVTYVLDDLAVTAGMQRAWLGTVGDPPLVWRRDRWEPARAGAVRRVAAGAALGGERVAIAHAGGDVIALPRHVAAALVATYASVARRPAATAALRLLARALPHVPRAARDVLVPYADPDADYERSRFAVIAQARRRFAAAQIAVHGVGLHRATALAAAWLARALAARGPGPLGLLAPGELLRPAAALRAIAAAAELALTPSFAARRAGA